MTQLAARAYLRAGQFSTKEHAAETFRELAREALRHHANYGLGHDTIDLSPLERSLAREVAAADAWFSSLAAKEKQWIVERRDVDREFAAAYYVSLDREIADAKTRVEREWSVPAIDPVNRIILKELGLFCALPLAIFVIFGIVYFRRRRLRAAKIAPHA